MRAHPVRGVGIERGGRLVEQQNLRGIDQRLGKRDAGLLSRRKLAGGTVDELRQVELARERRNAAFEILNRVEQPEHGEILPHRQPVRHVDIRALEIHLVQHMVALARHLGAEHLDGAGGGRDEAHDHGDGGGLAGAVAAEKSGDGATLERERNAVDRTGGLVDLHQLVNGDGGLGGLGHVGYRWRASATCGPAGRTRQGPGGRGNAPLPARPAAGR